MTETPEPIAMDQVTAQDLAEVIAEFEQYRERLFNEMMTAAQRAKVPKAKVLPQIEPELAKIDVVLQDLRNQQAALVSGN